LEIVVVPSARLLASAFVLAAASLGAQAAPPAAPASPAAPAAPATPAAPAPLSATDPAVRAQHAAAMALGRATVRQALTGQVDSLIASADPETGPADALRGRLTDGIAAVALQVGAERRVIGEKVLVVNGRVEYQRTGEYEMVPVPLVFRVLVSRQGKWLGFTANTVENTPGGDEVQP
jgi:hypothetical protein